MNTITVTFEACSPSPANGYRIVWRVKGSGDPFTDAGTFPSSPAVFNDPTGNFGDEYEGLIYGDCGGGLTGIPIPWDTETGGGEGSGEEQSGNVWNLSGDDTEISALKYGGINLVYGSGATLPMADGLAGYYSYPYLTSGDTLLVQVTGTATGTLKVTDNAGLQTQAMTGPGAYNFTITINPSFPYLFIEIVP